MAYTPAQNDAYNAATRDYALATGAGYFDSISYFGRYATSLALGYPRSSFIHRRLIASRFLATVKTAIILEAFRRTPQGSGEHDKTHCVKQAEQGDGH